MSRKEESNVPQYHIPWYVIVTSEIKKGEGSVLGISKRTVNKAFLRLFEIRYINHSIVNDNARLCLYSFILETISHNAFLMKKI